MKIPQTYVQRSKAILHGVQTLFIFLAGCLVLGVLTKEGHSDGRVGFMFALCFLTVPALIYQVMVPMWTRAWRFANVYAYAALDVLFAICWLAAFAALASFNSQGLSKGEKDCGSKDTAKDDSRRLKRQDTGKTCSRGCANFGFGSESRCKVSEAGVAFGVLVCLLFVGTSIMSIVAVLKFRRTGLMPGEEYENEIKAKYTAPHEDAWNPSTNDLDDVDVLHERPKYDPDDERKKYGQVTDDDDQEGLLKHISNSDPHPGRPLSYASSQQLGYQAGQEYDAGPPKSALSPTGYGDEHEEPATRGTAHFPSANYSGI